MRLLFTGSLMFLTGCCCKAKWDNDFNYGSEVTVVKGFFQGSKGILQSRNSVQGLGCPILGYNVELCSDVGGCKEHFIPQDYLKEDK